MGDLTPAEHEHTRRQRLFVLFVRSRLVRARLDRTFRECRWLTARSRLLLKEWRAIRKGASRPWRAFAPTGVTVLRERAARQRGRA